MGDRESLVGSCKRSIRIDRGAEETYRFVGRGLIALPQRVLPPKE